MTDMQWMREIQAAVARAEETAPGGLVSRLQPTARAAEVATKTAVVAFAIEGWMANPAGYLHGGMIAAFVDSAIGAAIRGYVGAAYSPTIGLQIAFLRPVAMTAAVSVRVKLSSVGKRITYATAELICNGNDEKIAATASGQFNVGMEASLR